MKIIEFAGLPGCGKSTLCKSFIAEKFPQKVYTYKDIIRFVSTKNRRKIYGIYARVNPFRWKLLKLLKAFSEKYDNISPQAVFILIALYDFTSVLQIFKKNSIVVLDEGFVQNITSIAHLQPINEDKELNDLVKYIQAKKNLFLVNCSADTDTVVERIRKRNGKDRFNSITDNKDLKNALSIKQDNITKVAKAFGTSVDVCLNTSTNDALKQLILSIDKSEVAE